MFQNLKYCFKESLKEINFIDGISNFIFFNVKKVIFKKNEILQLTNLSLYDL